MTDGTNADIVIIGAGVIGSSIAYHLARRKAGRVVVVDKGAVAHGGSGRSSALVRMHYSYPGEVRLAVKSLEMFRNWKDIVGADGDFQQIGFVRIVPEGEIDRLKANVEMQRSLGVDVELVTAEELRAIEPDWSVDDVPLAAYEPGSGYGDGAGVATGFMARAKDLGVQFRPYTPVRGIEVAEGAVRGVRTDDGLIESRTVVAAIGPWTKALLEPIGVDLPIEPEMHEVVFLKNAPGSKPRGCACIDSITKTYFRSEAGGLTLLGGFYGKRGVDPDDFPQAVSHDGVVELTEAASRRVPKLADAGMMRGITGVYDMSPDARPLIGETSVRGLHVAVGFSGMGFKISPAVGLAVAELLTNGRADVVDLHPFRPSRFAEGQPIRAEYEYQDD